MAGKEITIGGQSYDLDDMTAPAKELLGFIQFVDLQIQQLQNELAIADTARFAYANAIKRETKSG